MLKNLEIQINVKITVMQNYAKNKIKIKRRMYTNSTRIICLENIYIDVTKTRPSSNCLAYIYLTREQIQLIAKEPISLEADSIKL